MWAIISTVCIQPEGLLDDAEHDLSAIAKFLVIVLLSVVM